MSKLKKEGSETGMSAMALDKFLSKPREIFVRNAFDDRQISMSFGRAADYVGRWSARPSVLIPPHSGWLRVMMPFEEIKNSEDFLVFVTRGALELWNPEDPNAWPTEYTHLTSLGKNPPTLVEKAEMSPPPVEADSLQEEQLAEGDPIPEVPEEDAQAQVVERVCQERLAQQAKHPVHWLQFMDILGAVEEENVAVQQQIEFHKRQIDFHSNSLLAAKRQFDEINPIYGVFLWLKENVFGDEPQKQLIRSALGGGPEAGDEVIDAKRRLQRFPSTYRTLLRRVKALSVDGKYANFQERADAYNKNGQKTPGAEAVQSAAERAAAKRIEDALRKGPPKKSKKAASKKATPKKKVIRKGSKHFACDLCGFVSPTPNGLGAHKFRVHGIKGAKSKKGDK
jgi:hypothetical protein